MDIEKLAILTSKGVIVLDQLEEFELKDISFLDLLLNGKLKEVEEWLKGGNDKALNLIPIEEVDFAPLYRNPRKIWGMGMNYKSVKTELGAIEESDPIFFMKPYSSLIGPNDSIIIPDQSNRTTAEAELAIIIGKTCKNIEENEVMDVIAGFTPAIDVTAADIHAANPRYLQRSKSFDTFFSFGPVFLSKSEVENVDSLSVATVLNGQIIHQNKVSNMIYSPENIVSFLSKVSTLHPGDIIITGTPGATVIQKGDRVECQIEGFEILCNSVI